MSLLPAPADFFRDPLDAGEVRVASELEGLLRPGCVVAMGDGVGAPWGLLRPLARAARSVGGVELVLGWYLGPRVHFPPDSFPVVRGYLGGYGLAGNTQVELAPVRLSAMPALLHGPWRPHVVLLSATRHDGTLAFASEASWMRTAADVATHVVIEVNSSLPACGPPFPARDAVWVVDEVERAPVELPPATISPAIEAIGHTVASLVLAGSSVQFGPGALGQAALKALEVPVFVDSGILSDPVTDLDRRGLLLGEPVAAYLAGTAELYDWADGRLLVHPVEHTHDISRLGTKPLVAINTALEIDPVGQVNVETVAGRTIAGIGGHPDFACAATRSVAGLSVVALPTVRGGQRTLVEELSGAVSTGRSDVDVVVTELGYRDLRGRSDADRRRLLAELW